MEKMNDIWQQAITATGAAVLEDMANTDWFVYHLVFAPNDARKKGPTTMGYMSAAKCNVLVNLTYDLVVIQGEKKFQFTLAVMKTEKDISSYQPGEAVHFNTLFKKDYAYPQNEIGIKAYDPDSLGHTMYADLKQAGMIAVISQGSLF